MTVSTRLLGLDDVAAMVALLRADREFMAPYEPARDEAYYTDDGHAVVVAGILERFRVGTTLPHVIVVDGRIVGRITLNEIVRGPLQSCSVGYWVNSADNGRGIATAAVRAISRVAFEELRLHRIQASTRLDNIASQRVLERTGFTRYGVAEKYLRIAGQWRDHVMYQLLTPLEDTA